MKLKLVIAVTAAGLLAALLALAGSRATAQTDQPPPFGSRPVVWVQAQHVQGTYSQVVPTLTPEQQAERERLLEEQYQRRKAAFQLRTDPNAPPAEINSPPSEMGRLKDQGAPTAPGDFAVYRNTIMTDTFTNNQTSSTNEPSLGEHGRTAFYTGNWYATLSGDYGQTFSYINPYTFFPNPGIGGSFCCDQVVYYERTRGLMAWYLQYTQNITGNNIVRVAIANGQQNLENGIWWWYDISPQMLGYPNGANFDFPDMSAGANYLYFTTNLGGASDAAIVLRLDLDVLAVGGSVALENFTSPLFNLRMTHGAGTTMYVGTQVDNNTLRIFSWPEGGAASSVDRDVNTWQTATSSAPSPDGSNWVQRDFHDILASWTANNQVGFMWDSSQGGGFTWPNVRYARFNISGMALADQGTIWNPTFAWAYPAVHPNDSGGAGGVIGVGGGYVTTTVPYPTVNAWIADSYNSNTIAPLENTNVATGNRGPASNRWGDYYTSRRHVQYGNTWIAGSFVLSGGGGNTNALPYFSWFGREANRPPTNHSIYVDLGNASWESGAAAQPYDTFFEGYYATVNNDTLIVQASTYTEGAMTLDKVITILSQGGSATVR